MIRAMQDLALAQEHNGGRALAYLAARASDPVYDFGVFATISGLVKSLAPMIQIRRVLARRSASDISIWTTLGFLEGSVVWAFWSRVKHDVPLEISSTAGAVVLVGLLAFVLYFRLGLRARQRAYVSARLGSREQGIPEP